MITIIIAGCHVGRRATKWQFHLPLRSSEPINLHYSGGWGAEGRVSVESLVSYHIHIHSICLKWREGGFNNCGYMVFKGRWDMRKRSIEWMRNFKGFYMRFHICIENRHATTLAHRLYSIYTWGSINKEQSFKHCENKWKTKSGLLSWCLFKPNSCS